MLVLSRKSIALGDHFKYGMALSTSASNLQQSAKHSIENTPIRSAKIIRREFVDYYKTNLDHTFIPSSSVIPMCDPSLVFVNAGMNQFKNIFLGHDKPTSSRVVNYQKCIRVGGKHNDMNIVGLDTYHHTFFEMLGNWSFGSYGKEKACEYAWDTLTKLYGIDKNQLYVTYFSGNEAFGMKPDLECREIWRKIGIPNNRILASGIIDNFWEMGVYGPCGPCTEIHIDRPLHPADKLYGSGNTSKLNLTELWNIVFIEFERLIGGDIVPLNQQYIDTGMGFERLVSIIQGKNCNYDTDLFQPIFSAIHTITNAHAYSGKFGSDDEYSIDTGYRIIADHTRMITIALADGMIPELNHKLRRIIRKTINIGLETFQSNNLLHELTYHVAESLGDVYPEIQANLKQIQALINYETELYMSLRASSSSQWQNLVKTKPNLAAISDTYAAGLVPSYELLQSTLLKNPNLSVLPGEIAFKIYDTHGLDLEAIEELAQTEGLTVDNLGFNMCLEKAKIRSRIGIPQTAKYISQSTIDYFENNNIPRSNDSHKYKYEYDGTKYRIAPLTCKLMGMTINGSVIKETSFNLNQNTLEDSKIGILLDRTSFYAQEGGQLSDKGIIYINNLVFNVTGVYKMRNYVIHCGEFKKSLIKNNPTEMQLHIGDEVTVEINEEHRTDLMRNHTATHLLNAALRKVFPVIVQKASVIGDTNLSFKFSTYGYNIQPYHLKQIEQLVNDCIQSKLPVNSKTINTIELMGDKGITIIPNEIYPESNLRIVEVNGSELLSREACCGTHVHNTDVLKQFSIVDVTSKKGSSNKTIVAVTGDHAIRKIAEENKIEKIYSIPELHIDDIKDVNKRKNILVTLLTLEMNSVVKSTVNPYVVHCFNSHNVEVESIPLQLIIEICDYMPVFLCAISNRKFKARCFVPNKYLSDSFNAHLWMEAIKIIIPIKIGSFKDEDQLINSHTKVLKLPRDKIVSLAESVMVEAEKFVLTHTKELISKNN